MSMPATNVFNIDTARAATARVAVFSPTRNVSRPSTDLLVSTSATRYSLPNDEPSLFCGPRHPDGRDAVLEDPGDRMGPVDVIVPETLRCDDHTLR